MQGTSGDSLHLAERIDIRGGKGDLRVPKSKSINERLRGGGDEAREYSSASPSWPSLPRPHAYTWPLSGVLPDTEKKSIGKEPCEKEEGDREKIKAERV